MPADKCCTPDAACHEQLRCLFLHAASIAHDIPIRLSVVLPMFRQLSPVTSLSCVGLHAGKAQAIIISIFTLLVVGGLVLNLSAGSWGPETAACTAAEAGTAAEGASALYRHGRRMLRDVPTALPAQNSTGAAAAASGASSKCSCGSLVSSASNSTGFTTKSITLVEAPGICSKKGAAQLGMLSFGAIYNNGAKLLPAAQKFWQANWAGAGLEAGQQAFSAALVTGVCVWGIPPRVRQAL